MSKNNIVISAMTEAKLRTWYGDGTGIKEIRRNLSDIFTTDLGFKIDLSMEDVKTVYTQLNLDLDNRPKVKKTFTFTFETHRLEPNETAVDSSEENVDPLEETSETDTELVTTENSWS